MSPKRTLNVHFIYSSVQIFQYNILENIPSGQRLHFRCVRWRAKSSYFSQASVRSENVASARRVRK